VESVWNLDIGIWDFTNYPITNRPAPRTLLNSRVRGILPNEPRFAADLWFMFLRGLAS